MRKKTFSKPKIDFKGVAMRVIGVSAGAVGGGVISQFIPGGATIQGAVKIALGALAPEFVKNSKIMESVGSGLIAVGALQLASGLIPAPTPAPAVSALPQYSPYLGAAPLPANNVLGSMEDVDLYDSVEY